MRRRLVPFLLAAALPAGAPAAHAAPTALVLTGGFSYPGGHAGSGTGSFWATGTATGPVAVTFDFTMSLEPCPLVEQLQGDATGAATFHFTALRVGAVATVTTSNGVDGAGLAAIAATSLRCGAAGDVTAVIAIAGT
jgi:hypothetical protein